ncbi:protein of unknown function [Caballeronia sp. S22]
MPQSVQGDFPNHCLLSQVLLFGETFARGYQVARVRAVNSHITMTESGDASEGGSVTFFCHRRRIRRDRLRADAGGQHGPDRQAGGVRRNHPLRDSR